MTPTKIHHFVISVKKYSLYADRVEGILARVRRRTCVQFLQSLEFEECREGRRNEWSFEISIVLSTKMACACVIALFQRIPLGLSEEGKVVFQKREQARFQIERFNNQRPRLVMSEVSKRSCGLNGPLAITECTK